nr:TadE family type IV pilus minor pilin [Arthrobacter celericrescens]
MTAKARPPRKQGRPGPGKDRGAVTAEFAVALPAVLLLLAMLLAGAAAGITQLRIEEAARAGARALARGEGTATVEGIARRLAGDTATAAVSTQGEWLDVTVSARVGGPFGAVIPWTLTARASARTEVPDRTAAPRPRIPGLQGSVDFLVLGGPVRGDDTRADDTRGDDGGLPGNAGPGPLRLGGAVA